MTTVRWRIAWVTVALLLLGRPLLAGEGERPRVGLVLSGGGALGMAHVGVLEWLEAHRVPVDYIAGTSMGGVIGGAYATGMTPAELRRLLTHIRWEEAFRRDPPYSQLTFRRKEDAIAFPGGFVFGWREGLKWPRGLIPAHPVGLLLSRISLPHTSDDSFDTLPIPFRTVAVDLESGEEVVIGDGSLPLALRATMAIPGVFTPVEWQGRLLADGGMLNNLPTDVAVRLGAERVIAVYVGGRLDRGTLESPLDLLSRSVNIITRQSVRRNRLLADVFLTPDLEGFGTSDYDRAEALMDAGYQAANTYAEPLRAMALGEAEWAAYLAARQARERGRIFTPAFVRVAGVDGRQAAAIARSLRHHVGRPLSPRALDAELTAIAGCGRFESLTYERARLDGSEGILVRVQEKPYGPPFVNALLEIDGTRVGETRFSVPGRLTLFGLGCPSAELRADVSFGSRTLLAAEYYRPWGRHGWFAAPRLFTDRDRLDVDQGAAGLAEYSTRRTGLALALGRYPNRDTELRAGLFLGHLSTSVRRGDPTLPAASGADHALFASWVTDGQDSAVVPTRGLRLEANAQWRLRTPGVPHDFLQVSAEASTFRPLSPRASLFAFASAGTTLGEDAPLVYQFPLSGPLLLTTCGRAEPRGSHLALAGIGALHRVSQLPAPVGGRIHLAAWYQYGSVFSDNQPDASAGCLGGGLLAETLAGPLFLGASLGGGSGVRLHFALGHFFKATGF
ncbi:MAG: BamA/TamA family outer membrane protein [Armatimonadetes bacterium]|nr:BamA/TamA family outer membrane protein [Armatimonadota bacterium]